MFLYIFLFIIFIMSVYLLYQKNNNTSKILSNLYLGNRISPNNSYDLIINCSVDLPIVIPNTIRINLKDSSSEADNMYNQIINKNVLEEIDRALKNNKKVLIHCFAGMQRSAAVTACYLIQYHNYNVEDAINFIKSKRRIAFFFKINFIETIKNIYIKNH